VFFSSGISSRQVLRRGQLLNQLVSILSTILLGGETTRGNLAYETLTLMNLDGWLTTIANVVLGCGHNQSLGVLWDGWTSWFRAKHFLFTKPVPRNLS